MNDGWLDSRHHSERCIKYTSGNVLLHDHVVGSANKMSTDGLT